MIHMANKTTRTDKSEVKVLYTQYGRKLRCVFIRKVCKDCGMFKKKVEAILFLSKMRAEKK